MHIYNLIIVSKRNAFKEDYEQAKQPNHQKQNGLEQKNLEMKA